MDDTYLWQVFPHYLHYSHTHLGELSLKFSFSHKMVSFGSENEQSLYLSEYCTVLQVLDVYNVFIIPCTLAIS